MNDEYTEGFVDGYKTAMMRLEGKPATTATTVHQLPRITTTTAGEVISRAELNRLRIRGNTPVVIRDCPVHGETQPFYGSNAQCIICTRERDITRSKTTPGAVAKAFSIYEQVTRDESA